MSRFSKSAFSTACVLVVLFSANRSGADMVIDTPMPPPLEPPTGIERTPNSRSTGFDRTPTPSQIRPVFFPPSAPIYSDPVQPAANVRLFNGRAFIPPEELADDVGELFYPVLGSRIFEQKLDDGLRQRLATYHATRKTLLNELHNALAAASAAPDPAAREAELKAFAAKQTPRIVKLEAEADQLREKLMRSLTYNADWNHKRQWKLDNLSTLNPFGTAAAEYQVLRAAAFYQSGLSVEQRGLLREQAILLVEDYRLRMAKGNGPNLTAIFFSPEGARLRLSISMVRKLGPQIATFIQLKNAMRRELRETVNKLDSLSDSKRTKALQELAESQWTQMVEAENLADEIRRSVAADGPPPLPAPPPRLPAELAAKIETYKRERNEVLQASMENLRAIAMLPVPRLDNRGDLRDAIQRRREAIEKSKAERQRLIDEFDQAYGERLKALDSTLAEIKADLDEVAKTETDPKTGRPVTGRELLLRLNLADMQFEKIGREEAMYPDYRIAMLEPGLSPEQRRLLFASAVTALAQPLPLGEKMPDGPFPLTNF